MVNMVQTKQNKENKYRTATGKEQESITQKDLKPTTGMACFFCKKARDCRKYKKWLEKKKRKANSLQEFTSKRLPSRDKVKVFVGNGEKVQVDYIGTIKIELDFGFVLELDEVVYVPSMKKSLCQLLDL
ncbi:hypothetical protein L3X38_035619 [Prunus dulcis]|uniref:Retrovirus-related Pol polyprotein from transposon TNT 1-94-like beta-barrel domain-containing protein n=1 Tax=Prunus dulcis TaxID=3755 RepID=A0AAD4YZ00_PRUDU|nr:hypothetical protein L3X38_035619 [Prunus dulcis]